MIRLLSYAISVIIAIIAGAYFGIDRDVMIIGIIVLSTTNILDELN